MCKTHLLIVTVGITALTLSARAEQVTRTFTDATGTGNWYQGATGGDNWDTGLPDSDDLAVIPANKTCKVNVTTATAGLLQVHATGTLNIQGSKTLTLAPLQLQISTISGTVNLEGSGSEVVIATSNHTFSGTGKLVGGNDAAKITISNNLTLTSSIRVEGRLLITDTGINGGTFVNGKEVVSSGTGVLYVNPTTVEDVAGAIWKVESVPVPFTPAPLLRFAPKSAVRPFLDGDFVVNRGGLLIDMGFDTVGALTITNGSVDTGVDTPNNYAIFSYCVTCPTA